MFKKLISIKAPLYNKYYIYYKKKTRKKIILHIMWVATLVNFKRNHETIISKNYKFE